MKDRLRRVVFDRYEFPAEAEPDGDVMAPHHLYIGLLVAWFSFQFVWPYYPTFGAWGTLAGLFIAGDDAVSHAFGVWTPLDHAWKLVVTRVPQIRR